MNTFYNKSNESEQAMFRKWIVDMLHIGPAKVTFIKNDGTEREMHCTLEEKVVVPHVKTTDRVKENNEEVCPVWDIDKRAWRSFRYDSVIKVLIDMGDGVYETNTKHI